MEVAQPVGCAEPAAGSIQYEEHLLDSAPSPLVRALPAYERDFRGHLLRARRLWEASQARLRDAEQLLSELVRPPSAPPAASGGPSAGHVHGDRIKTALLAGL